MNGIFEIVTGKMITSTVKPFVKWAGGKAQLLESINEYLPKDIHTKSYTFVEPFVGGGAVFIWMLQRYENVEKVIINDSNLDLINTYRTIKKKPRILIEQLKKLENAFFKVLENEEKKKKYYYKNRELFNARKSDDLTQSALFIFLNKTCFNGLYRVNKSNEFNVPIGSYKKPTICDEKNIMALHKLFKKVTILHNDYESTYKYASDKSVFYFDPPYKPISQTSSFTSYGKTKFDDHEQQRLKLFCDKLQLSGTSWLLSNSDPKNDFFDKLYQDYHIHRIKARRNINSKSKLRGKINELLITNYPTN